MMEAPVLEFSKIHPTHCQIDRRVVHDGTSLKPKDVLSVAQRFLRYGLTQLQKEYHLMPIQVIPEVVEPIHLMA
jgi:hypothetical protein